jgi:competence ComEA-like helix-hairpin-helix protein
MTRYTRRQIVVLLIVLAIAGLGLAIGHWRRARPDAADYLEQLDRAPAPTPNLASDPEPEPRRSRRRKASPESAHPRSLPSGAGSGAVDLNRATTDELTRLPGVGPALARRIVDVRDAEGPFARVDELGRVRGMSARKVGKLRAFVTVSE